MWENIGKRYFDISELGIIWKVWEKCEEVESRDRRLLKLLNLEYVGRGEYREVEGRACYGKNENWVGRVRIWRWYFRRLYLWGW